MPETPRPYTIDALRLAQQQADPNLTPIYNELCAQEGLAPLAVNVS